MENTETKTIEVVVNGHRRHVPDGLSIAGLLAFLEIDASRVAVELNREIVRKTAWESTMVTGGAPSKSSGLSEEAETPRIRGFSVTLVSL